MTKYLLIALAVLAVTAGMFAMHFHRALIVSRAATRAEHAQAEQLRGVIQTERESAQQFEAISQQYEQDKTDAEANASKLAADLRAERVRLRPIWRCEASVPATAASAGKPDAAHGLQAESLGRIDRAVSELQAQRDALQAIVKAERQ
jgi:hypothetical protein